MIKIGIIGFGNVTWNVHLPILLSRKDIKISWICDPKIKKKKILEKKNIAFFKSIDNAIDHEEIDIALITVPYHERKNIFEKIKKNVKGIYFEKPFALNEAEHKYFSKNFENYALTVGFQRRKMGVVSNIKHIIDQNILGKPMEISIDFGDIHYKFDSYRSDISKSGGGIFFETGSHWVDTVLFTTSAKKINEFNVKKVNEDNLDIESNGFFKIINDYNHQIECKFYFTTLKNTSNKISYKFNNCSIDLYLFEDEANLILKNKNSKKFSILNEEKFNFPCSSLGVGALYWDDYLNSFKNKKRSDISIENFLLTTKLIELFYEK
ncbi:Gfo/Idh/MocA family protein [Candidatus Pelagibacter sp.]|uniref:Gfo/Idh/MocA family protein n=1 Tax=Candidatus Pelagibacter sp. TaxID=2024849 RepID=UPI003F82A3EE